MDFNDMFKAKKHGEGSRGGKVIGHTKGGKAIYAPNKSTQSAAKVHHAFIERNEDSTDKTTIQEYRDLSRKLYSEAQKHAVATSAGWSRRDHKDAAKKHYSLGGFYSRQFHTPEGHAHQFLGHAHLDIAEGRTTVKQKELDKSFDFSDLFKARKAPYGHTAYQRGGHFVQAKGMKPAKDPYQGADEPMAHHLHEMVNSNARELNSKDYMMSGSEGRGEHHMHRRREAIRRNLINKMASGKYDHEKAKKLWGYLADDAAKHHEQHWHSDLVDAPTRRLTAHHMAEQFKEEVAGGQHRHHLQKKYHAKKKVLTENAPATKTLIGPAYVNPSDEARQNLTAAAMKKSLKKPNKPRPVKEDWSAATHHLRKDHTSMTKAEQECLDRLGKGLFNLKKLPPGTGKHPISAASVGGKFRSFPAKFATSYVASKAEQECLDRMTKATIGSMLQAKAGAVPRGSGSRVISATTKVSRTPKMTPGAHAEIHALMNPTRKSDKPDLEKAWFAHPMYEGCWK